MRQQLFLRVVAAHRLSLRSKLKPLPNIQQELVGVAVANGGKEIMFEAGTGSAAAASGAAELAVCAAANPEKAAANEQQAPNTIRRFPVIVPFIPDVSVFGNVFLPCKRLS